MSKSLTVDHDRPISRGWIFGLVLVGVSALACLVLGVVEGYSLSGALAAAVVVGLSLLAWRRYLRSVSFDPEKSTITAKSVLPLLTFVIPLSRLKSVRTVRAVGIPRLELVAYNLVLRRKWAIQPLLFEVTTSKEHAAVQRLLASLPDDLLSLGSENAVPPARAGQAVDEATGLTSDSTF
jgi:hypothetical protein